MTTMTMRETSGIATPPSGDERLTVRHMIGVLIGRRDSIMTAARDRGTLWAGLLLVMSAALARDYDRRDLMREPWHLLLSPAASFAVSLVLFAIVRGYRNNPRPFWAEFRAFLGLFWLTAPIALLYAIPYERFLSPVNGVAANLWTLAFVAAWRVALMTRIVSVFTGRSMCGSFWLVMLVADAIAAGALLATPIPVLSVMGGVRLSDADQLIEGVGLLARLVSVGTLLLWLIGAYMAFFRPRKPQWELDSSSSSLPAPGPIALAIALFLAWTLILPMTQREQRLRTEAERLLRSDQIDSAIAVMSRHARSDYPPHWDPPPRVGWPEAEQPEVLAVMDVLSYRKAAPWVREIYIDKFERRWLGLALRWEEEKRDAVLRMLTRLPEGPALMQKNANYLGILTTQPATRGSP